MISIAVWENSVRSKMELDIYVPYRFIILVDRYHGHFASTKIHPSTRAIALPHCPEWII